MPRAPQRPKRRQGKQQSRSRSGQPLPQQRLNQQVEAGKRLSSGTRVSGMAETIARRYSIEIKDAETGNSLILIVAEWTIAQKGAGIALISQLSSLHEGECCLNDGSKPSRSEPHHD
jgi:hypothetical protein